MEIIHPWEYPGDFFMGIICLKKILFGKKKTAKKYLIAVYFQFAKVFANLRLMNSGLSLLLMPPIGQLLYLF